MIELEFIGVEFLAASYREFMVEVVNGVIRDLRPMLDAGCWMFDAGCSILDSGYWILDTGSHLAPPIPYLTSAASTSNPDSLRYHFVNPKSAIRNRKTATRNLHQ
jgi:hypothetical protein